MNGLTELQRRILEVLEEAGEDDVSALVNTVEKRRGSFKEIDLMSQALTALISCDFLEIAKNRDTTSLRWIPLSKQESLTLFKDLRPFFEWSSPEQLWKWRRQVPRVEVLLTDAGLVMARRILSSGTTG